MKLNNQDTSVDEEHIQSTLFISMVFIDAYLNIKMKSYHNKNDFCENRYFLCHSDVVKCQGVVYEVSPLELKCSKPSK